MFTQRTNQSAVKRRGKRGFANMLMLCAVAMLATVLFPSVASAAPTCRGKTVTINMNTNGGNGNGTPGNDVILGTPGNDVIKGGNGVDTICGGLGRDKIYGGGGSDRIRGEGGSDFIYGGSGADDIWGGGGHDLIYGQGGKDDIWGESGNDTIQGNWQSDKLYGGAGNDTIAGADGADKIYGQDGNDTLRGGNNSDHLYGGNGNDNLSGGSGSDVLNGEAGTDTCNGETEINCATAPEWMPGAAVSWDLSTQVSIEVSWCCFVGSDPEYAEVYIADSSGYEFFLGTTVGWDYEVDNYGGNPLDPYELYTIKVVPYNDHGPGPIRELGPVTVMWIEEETTSEALAASPMTDDPGCTTGGDVHCEKKLHTGQGDCPISPKVHSSKRNFGFVTFWGGGHYAETQVCHDGENFTYLNTLHRCDVNLKSDTKTETPIVEPYGSEIHKNYWCVWEATTEFKAAVAATLKKGKVGAEFNLEMKQSIDGSGIHTIEHILEVRDETSFRVRTSHYFD